MNGAAFDEMSSRRAYRQLFELGRGGMAKVYLAESLGSGIRKLVVLKVLNRELSANPEMRGLFRREAELAAQMNHPNVVQVMEVVESGESPIIVMEYLDGTSLALLLKRKGSALSLAVHLQILCQVLAGLHHFHELRDLDGAPLNGVHRDVSPQNIMVLHDGPVKVLDFGIAKVSAPDIEATRTGIIKGRIQYMPPEQLLGAAIDRRADLFAVGVMLWEAVAGRRMWEGMSEVELFRSLAGGEIPDLRKLAPEASESLVQLVQRATAVEPEKRFANALEMRAAIEQTSADNRLIAEPHELATFMSQHFGEARQMRQIEIKAALRSDPASDGMIECVGGRPHSIASQLGDTARTTARPVDLQISRAFRVAPRKWGLAAAAFASLVVIGTCAVRRPLSTSASGAGTPVRKTVAFEVQALPEEAEIFLNDQLLATKFFSGQVPLVDHKAVLEVRAPGYLSERKVLTLTRDMSLQIVLTAEPRVVATGAASVTPIESAVASSPPRSPVIGKAPKASRSAKCNPPYVFAADGVKTFKPECF